MTLPSKPIPLPIATIQHDFQSVLTDVREGIVPFEDIWISCYKLNELSVHGKVRVELDESNRNHVILRSRDGVEIHPELGIQKTKLSLPSRTFSNRDQSDPRHPVQITAFDISADGSQFATGYDTGVLHVEPAHGPKFTNTSKPHIAAVTSLRFFPSSKVLLTAGADFSLSIVSAEPVQSDSHITPARILKGHTRSITETAIISRGKNVLSCAKDGTMRLWDVSGGKSIRTLGSYRWFPILSMSMGIKGNSVFGPINPDGDQSPVPSVDTDPKEVDTSDKVIFCALGNGSLEAFDLGTKLSIHRTSVSSGPLIAVDYSPAHNLVATGSIDGVVTVYDTRSLSAPVTSFTRNSLSIEALAITDAAAMEGEHEVGVVVATEDGLSYVASIRPEGPAVLSELVGSDCDAVRFVRIASSGIWTAGDDGIVRRY